MAALDEDSARIALIELAEAFGVPGVPEEFYGDKPDFLGLAMAHRLYLDGDKAVYKLSKEIELKGGESPVTEFRLREAKASDYTGYSKGASIKITAIGTELDMVMVARRTIKTVAAMGDQPEGIVDRMTNRDLHQLTKICEALGFFE